LADLNSYTRRNILVALFLSLALPALLGQADEATDIWDLANGLYIRGDIYHKDAIEQYRKFIKTFPGDPRVDLATFRLAEIYRKEKDYRKALDLYLEHQKKFKNSDTTQKVQFRAGQMYYLLGKYSEAESHLKKIHNKTRNDNIKHSSGFYLGRTYFDLGDYTKATGFFLPLANNEKNPFYPFANYYAAESLSKLGKTDQAALRYQKVAKTSVSVAAESAYKAARIYSGTGQYAYAYAAYRRVVYVYGATEYRSAAKPRCRQSP